MGIYQGSKLMSGGGGGPSPYEIANQNGYTGTEQEFNRLLAALDQNVTEQDLNNKADLVNGKVPAEQVDAYTKTEADTLLQKKADKDRVVNPNLLDNWYFGNPIDQRQGRIVKPNTTYYSDNTLATSAGTTSAYVTAYRYATGTASGVNYASFKLEDSDTAPTYYAAPENVIRGYTGGVWGVDRWICSGVVISDNGLTFTAQTAYIVQPIEAWKKEALDGKTVTISALLSNGELVTGYNVYTAAHSENVYFAIGKVQLLIQTNGNLLVWADTQATVEAVKLELGSQQTLAHQDENGNWVLNEIPDYGEQLRRCQRYQFVPDIGNPSFKSYQFTYVAGASGSVNGNLVGSIPFPVTMRTAPSVVIAGKQIRDNSTGSVMTISSLSVAFTTKDALTYLFGVAAEGSTFIEGHQYALTDQLIFDANL